MSWYLHAQNTPRPKPKPNKPGQGATSDPKNPADTPTTGTSDNTPSDDGNLLSGLGGFLLDHPIAIPILLIAALIGIQYGWSQLRKKQALRGVAVRPLGMIVRDLLKFAFKEDKRPLHAKTPWLLATRFYLATFALTLIGLTIGVPGIPAPAPLLALILVLAARYRTIAGARKATVNQMFAVAHGECRYPKGSELQPWSYINVTNWMNLTQPGLTVVTIPAAYQSEDQKTREKFERQFSGTVSEENAWTYKWESAKNRVVCEPAAFLPNMAPYPGPGEKWDEIPVGVKGDGTQAIIPLSMTPHTLVCGPTGSGKSVLQRSILNHVLAHDEIWRIVAIDMKKVEMAFLRKYPQVLKVATDLEEAVEVLRSLKAEMYRRYEEMEEAQVNHAKDLPDPPKAILCMIDESTVLLAPEGVKSDEGKERDALHAEAGMIIGELGRLSRASMIHVVACFQRPDATFLKGETKANFDARIAAGRMDTTPSLMVLDSEAANRLPKIKGRGMIRIGGELDTFQGFFAEQSWFDEWLAQRDAAARGESPDVADPDGSPDMSTPMPEAAAPSKRGKKSKKVGGLKALAAKAAARAARLDAEADAASDGGPVVPGLPVEDPLSAGAVPVSPPQSDSPVPAPAPGPDSEPAPVAAPAPVAVTPTGGPEFDPAADLTSMLERPSFDDLDLDDEDFEEDEDDFDAESWVGAAPGGPPPGFGAGPMPSITGVPAQPAPVAPAPPQPQPPAPTPVAAPPAAVPPVRTAGPPPVTPAPVYKPGDPLPSWLAGKQEAAEAAEQDPEPRPSGLPVQRPQGLPTRPPQAG